ncbi:MAG: bifunctional phosphoribosyl-AMP cyclohydrolase/phosphoribosyl-ATP diphosphatase HisIE [Bacteroidota bacterium]
MSTPNFQKSDDGLIPCIIQDAQSKTVLMLGYMNEESFKKTIKEQVVTFFSRSKNRLWTKGETSGNFLNVVDIKVDCDDDTTLIKVNPVGPVCHTGKDTCFDEVNKADFGLKDLESVIKDRKENPKEGSYTTSLFNKGINKIAQKVGEEAVEIVIEAKDSNDGLFKNEAADLMYHFIVLLQQKGFSLSDIEEVLAERHQ